MSQVSFDTIERIAIRLCEARHGAGSWYAAHRRKADYRAEAQRQIQQLRVISTADALMAIFGLRPVGK